MTEDSYMIARVVFLVCLLVWLASGLVGQRLGLPMMIRNAALWAAIAAGAVLLHAIWRG